MKSLFLLAGVGAAGLLLSGCAPELDQTQLSPEEQVWAKTIKANYGAWEVPESVPRSVRRDDLTPAQNDAAVAGGVPAEVPSAPVEAPAAVADAAPAPVVEAAPAPVAAEANAAVDGGAAAPVAESEVYTVVKGDTLGGIARKYYGKASVWKRIQDANSDLLKGKTLIRPGMKLQIPRP